MTGQRREVFSFQGRLTVERMFSIAQNKGKDFHETFLSHFKENKVEIANAITKSFPFFESLRDHSFITEKTYNESQEACKNLVPVGKVVYQILCQLEKTLDRSLLKVLFSKVHLKEYPDLIPIQRSFEDVTQDKSLSWESDGEKNHKMPSTQPSFKQVPGKSKALRIKRERMSEEFPSLLLNDGQVVSSEPSAEEASQEA